MEPERIRPQRGRRGAPGRCPICGAVVANAAANLVALVGIGEPPPGATLQTCPRCRQRWWTQHIRTDTG